ncbi:MAG: hypothetical protein D6775_06635, partial [Caldilineae bacterium]
MDLFEEGGSGSAADACPLFDGAFKIPDIQDALVEADKQSPIYCRFAFYWPKRYLSVAIIAGVLGFFYLLYLNELAATREEATGVAILGIAGVA